MKYLKMILVGALTALVTFVIFTSGDVPNGGVPNGNTPKSDDHEIPLNEQKIFINAHLASAQKIEQDFGIPIGVSLGIAAMTSEFGREPIITDGNAFFILEYKKDANKGSTPNGITPVGFGSEFIRGYQTIDLAYHDFALEVSQQSFYPSVKGKPINEWYPHLKEWGYGIEEFVNHFPSIQKLSGLHTVTTFNNVNSND